ncbi:MAG TPA: hypothetical protein VM759_05305 [Longimicrobium sp.]|nr:hypothetical protein [Longimicrobium sp.]
MPPSVLNRPVRTLPAGARLIALAPDAAHAVRVLATAGEGAALASLLPADGDDPSQRITRLAATLAERIVAHATGGPLGPSAGALRGEALALEGEMERLRRQLPEAAARQMPSIESAPLALAAAWMEEAALEAHGHALMLMTHPEHEVVAGIRALHPAETLARAAERVLDAAEVWAAHDGLLELEIEAAYWFSERWSAEDDDGERGLRSVRRRMEWALGERATLGRGEPVLAALLGSVKAATWPKTRRQAARALVRSVAGAFHVLERRDDGEVARVRSLTDGRELWVRDPYGEALPGRVLMGRALPSGGGEHVFALSAELVSTEGPGDLRAIEADVRAFAARLPLAVALEATIADGLFGARIPRAVAPAADPEDALARLDELRDRLMEQGLVQELEHPGPVPPGATAELLALPADGVLQAWIGALVGATGEQEPHLPLRRMPEPRYGT